MATGSRRVAARTSRPEQAFRTWALANQQKGLIVVLVVHQAGWVAGCYGLPPTVGAYDITPRLVRTRWPPSSAPCLLLGQFVTDWLWAGPGVGTVLLAQAPDRCMVGAGLIGGRTRVVTALDHAAGSLSERRGLLSGKDDNLVLFRSIPAVAASLAAACARLTLN